MADAEPPQETERGFQEAVLELAQLCGWRCYHTHDSRRSHPGFPDLVLVRGVRLIFAELKSQKGRVSPAQRDWLDALTVVAQAAARADELLVPPIFVRLWRPSDWPEIEETLRKW